MGGHGRKEEALSRPPAVATYSCAALTAPDVDTPLLFFLFEIAVGLFDNLFGVRALFARGRLMAFESTSSCPRLAPGWFWLAERGVGSSPIDSPDVAAGWSPRRPARRWRPGWPALVHAHYSDTAVIISRHCPGLGKVCMRD